MIAHFPEPYQDELLYSVLARCAGRLNERSNRSLAWLFYENGYGRVEIDLPRRLEVLASKIPGSYNGHPARLASKLTLLPLFKPFLRVVHARSIEELMIRSNTQNSRSIASLAPLKNGQPASLRFCPECWEQDKRSTGEPYWRRAHQAPGNLLCHNHRTALWLGPVAWSFRQSWQRYVAASTIKLEKCVKEVVPSKAIPLLAGIAADTHWLLSKNNYNPGSEKLQNYYFQILRDLRLTSGRFVRCNELKNCMMTRLRAGALDWLAEKIRFPMDWIERLVQPSKVSRTSQPPLRHLLLIRAISEDTKSFFWQMQTLDSHDHDHTLHEDIDSSVDRVRQIRQWWNDDQISVNEMARRLGISPDTVNLAAVKDELPFPRSKPTSSKVPIVFTHSSHMTQRDAFIRVMAANPYLGLKDLKKKNEALVRWLYRHDWKWLRDNRPVAQRKGGSPGLDWAKRDNECVQRLRDYADKLDTGQQLSVSVVERALNVRFANLKGKLPKATRVLQSIVERQSSKSRRTEAQNFAALISRILTEGTIQGSPAQDKVAPRNAALTVSTARASRPKLKPRNAPPGRQH